MLVLLIIIAAPIAQIILSTLRIKRRIGLPIGAITALSFMLGIVLTFAALNIVAAPPQLPGRIRCGTGEAALLFCGLLLQLILAPTIALISYGIYKLKSR